MYLCIYLVFYYFTDENENKKTAKTSNLGLILVLNFSTNLPEHSTALFAHNNTM